MLKYITWVTETRVKGMNVTEKNPNRQSCDFSLILSIQHDQLAFIWQYPGLSKFYLFFFPFIFFSFKDVRLHY